MDCSCGSGKDSWVEYDGYGIYMCRVCDSCVEKKLKGFRSDIFDKYECDEPIEPED